MQVAQPEHAQVTFVTAHSSKGLEWDNVVLGPDFQVPLDEKGEIIDIGDFRGPNRKYKEETNLLYVACTRAKKKLYVSNKVNKYLEQLAETKHGGDYPETFQARTSASASASSSSSSAASSHQRPSKVKKIASDYVRKEDLSSDLVVGILKQKLQKYRDEWQELEALDASNPRRLKPYDLPTPKGEPPNEFCLGEWLDNDCRQNEVRKAVIRYDPRNFLAAYGHRIDEADVAGFTKTLTKWFTVSRKLQNLLAGARG